MEKIGTTENGDKKTDKMSAKTVEKKETPSKIEEKKIIDSKTEMKKDKK